MKSCGFAVTGIGLTLASILATSPIAAQARIEGRGVRVLPATPRTPYGLCRIWINGLPSVRQPAATGCAYAYSNVPRNGRVIYGGERGELFRRSDPYYYDRDARNRDYDDERGYRDSYYPGSYYPDSYYPDSYGYNSRYRRDADDRDRSNWRYRTDDRYGSSGHSRRHRDGGDESSGWSGRDRSEGGRQGSHDRGNRKRHSHGNGSSSGTGHGRWK